MAVVILGCSGEGAADPEEVIGTALGRKSLLDRPIGPAEVEVASLGFNDAVLEERVVPIDASTHRDVLEALAGAPGGRDGPGLVGLARDLRFREADAGSGTGAERDHLDSVTGTIEADDLVEALRSSGAGQDEIEGVGGVDGNLVRAEFTLYTEGQQRDFSGLDLILVQDDPGNALPPSRIRFRLPASEPGRVGSGDG
jgi:hypothetical protein